MVMIEQAFHTYTKAVETKFKASRRPPTTKRGLVELRNKARHLCDLVDQLEDGPEFSALVEKTRSAFHGDWHSARKESWWRDPIHNFFRRTGYYTDAFFKGSDTSCDWFERYEKAFQRRHVQTTYLAPVEFVSFPKPELKFSGFEIRRFDRKEFEEIVGNDVNRVLYPYAFFHNETLAALQEYWFIVVRIPEEARRLGRIYSSAAVAAAVKGRVFLEYTRFPPAIERVLARLVLFDWVGDPQDPLTYSGQDGLPFGFKIPFVLRVDDNDLKGPESAPDCSKLKSYGTKVRPGYRGRVRSSLRHLQPERVSCCRVRAVHPARRRVPAKSGEEKARHQTSVSGNSGHSLALPQSGDREFDQGVLH